MKSGAMTALNPPEREQKPESNCERANEKNPDGLKRVRMGTQLFGRDCGFLGVGGVLLRDLARDGDRLRDAKQHLQETYV